MKTFTGLILLALFATVWTASPIKLTPGQSYIYSYCGRMKSGVAQYEQNVALWQIKSDIVLQAEQHGQHIAMQMTNIRVGKHNGQIVEQMFASEMPLEHQRQQEYEEELSKPIRFYWDNGQIKNFEADHSDQEWSVNMKKSILSLFNINLTPKRIASEKQNEVFQSRTDDKAERSPLVVYPVYEDGLNGVCETYYQIIKTDDRVLNVTKTRNYGNCLTRPTFETTNSDFRGASVICHKGYSYPLIEGYYPMIGNDYQIGGCQPVADSQESAPVKLYHYVQYNISTDAQQNALQIDSIFGQGKTVLQTKDKQMLLISEQNVTLVDIVNNEKLAPIKQIRQILLHQELSYRLPMKTSKMDIPYYQLYGEIDKQELQQLFVDLLHSVANDIEATQVEPSKNTMQKVVQLANAVAVLDSEHFDQIFDKVARQARTEENTTDHQRIVRKLFLDLISYAGTTESALYAKQLYEQDQITSQEAKEMFEAVPQNLFLVDAKVVEAYLNTLLSDRTQSQSNLASSVGIALGKLINQAAIKQEQKSADIHDEQSIRRQQQARQEIQQNRIAHKRLARSAPWYQHFKQQLMTEQQVQQVIQVIDKALKSASTFDQKITMIETLAHTGTAQALAILAPYVQNKVSTDQMPGYQVDSEQDLAEERNFIRQVTIYSLSHMAATNGAQVSSLLLPIFNNKNEPYEIRIAAFTVLLTCDPGKAILEQISTAMHQESNRQVKSFVVSALTTVANYSEPSSAKLADDARFALGFAPKETLGLFYSKMIGQSYYDHEKEYGVNLMAEWVASNVSQIPRSAYMAAREIDASTQNIFLEAGYNVKGLDTIIEQLFDEEKGIIKRAIWKHSNRKLQGQKASTSKAQELKEKFAPVQIRTEDEPKATVFLKMFERTSYYSFDRQLAEEFLNSAQEWIENAIGDMAKGKDYHYVKLAMPKQMYKVVSSEIGLPVIVTERHPTIVSVKFNQAKLQLKSKNQSKSTVSFNVQIEPSVYHTNYQFIYGLLPVNNEAVGTNIEKCTRMASPIALSVSYETSTGKVSCSITPKVPQEVYHHETKSRTFITKSVIAGSPQRQWLQGSSVIAGQRQPVHYERQYFKQQLGIGLSIKGTTNEQQRQSIVAHSLMEAVFGGQDQITPSTVHVMLEADQTNPVTGYDFEFEYNKVHIDSQQQQQQNQNEQVQTQNIKQELRRLRDETSNQDEDESADIVAHQVQISAQTQSVRSANYSLDVLYAHTYDQKNYWTSAQVKSSTGPQQICFQSKVNYEKTASPFNYESIQGQDLKATVSAKLNFANGDCRYQQTSESGQVKLDAVMKTGEERMKEQPSDWFYQQCKSDQSNGQANSYACQQAIIEDSYFKRFDIDIHYDQLPEQLINLTSKLAMATKVAFYQQLEQNEVNVHNEQNKVKITGQYCNQDSKAPTVNVEIQTPNQSIRLSNLKSSYFRPPSALLSTGQVYTNLLTGSMGFKDQCTVMSEYIRTFDNVTIKLADSSCEYLLAKDCSKSNKFTIYLRQIDQQSKNKQVTLVVDDKQIILTPDQVQIDGQVIPVQSSQALQLSEGQMTIYGQETSTAAQQTITIQHDKHDFNVQYDGRNVKVSLGQQYKGETCGICGDDNHESDSEFRGPDRCVYDQEEHFINSYADEQCSTQQTTMTSSTVHKQCPQTRPQQNHQTSNSKFSQKARLSTLIGQWTADMQNNQQQQQRQQMEQARQQQQMARRANAVQQQSNTPLQRYRTMSLSEPDRVCFSVQPTLTCVHGVSRPTHYQQQVLAFHCLPSQSISAQKLVQQSQYQVLEIFGNKQVDFYASIKVPVSCQAL